MTNDAKLSFLEDHEDLVNKDDWDSIYKSFLKDYPHTNPLTTYLHELGFDPLPYMTTIPCGMYWDCGWLTSIDIHSRIESIGDYAFAFCRGLTSMTLPDSVASIGANSFLGCSNMKKVIIPNSVTYIDVETFDDCENLEDIVYKGTIEQWNKIEKDIYFGYGTPAEVVHCTDGDVKIQEE